MGLETGARVGPYRITGVLGAGGMGEVYRAHDSSLGRDVALKVLPPDVASDKERLARFAREARVLASLDHPNIGTIHGWEDSTGLQAIVLELVEGPTLRERMASGPMRLDDALGIARQIADALESAHEQGIVHRDLKPANIKIRPDGRVKVLDFGLAKALEGDEGRPNDSATTVAATRSGVALGTPAYMSPEQARGEAVNRRTDIWSFGVVLFEMLAGRHPFGSGPPTEVMAAILRATPEWEALPAGTPPQVTRLLRRCLEKDPRSRIHDIGDARLELEDAIAGRSSSPSGSTHAASSGGIARGWSRGAQIGAAAGGLIVVGAAITGAYVLGARRAAPLSAPAAEMRFQVMAPADAHFQNAPAVSPDGRSIAFVAAPENGQNQLWVKALSATTATVLPGTKGAIFPFWSPDSASIGFFAEGQLKRVSARGDSPPSKVCDASLGRGGAWFDDGTIVFAPDGFAPLLRVPASGGTPIGLTELNKAQGELSHRFPARVSGKYLLFYVQGNDREAAGARLISLDDPSHQIKSYPGIDEAEYADGFLFTVKNGQLRAQAMHLPGGELSGDVVPIGAVVSSETGGRAVWSAAPGGVIALMGPASSPSQLMWRGRDGRELGPLGSESDYQGVELSPTRQQVATTKAGGTCLLLDASHGAANRVLKGWFPAWSEDGSLLAVMGPTAPASFNRVVAVPAAGAGSDIQLVSDTSYWPRPVGWTPDGKTFVWIQGNGPDIDILMAPTGQPDRVQPYLRGAGRNVEGRLSPNGDWIAYASDPDPTGNGRFEIVIQRFPSPGGRYPVSIHGGRFPRWRADGKELYYVSGSTLMAASVTLADPPVVGTPQKLFDVKLVTERDPIVFATYEYDVGDVGGTRFLVNEVLHEPIQALDVIVNWNRK